MASNKTRKAWIEATRPRTLPASAAPVITATAYAWYDGSVQWVAATLCLFFAMLAQIASNMANDYYDYKKGGDTPNRVGPQRAVVSGLISPRAMLTATLAVLVAACSVGMGLTYFGGWKLIPVGVIIAIFALAYSAGPIPLSRYGLGDVTVFLFFGFIAVNFTYYVQAGYFTLPVLLVSIAHGLLAINILIVNNYRDMEEDAGCNKRTTVVLFGRKFASIWYLLNGILAVLYAYKLWLAAPPVVLLLPVLFLILHIATYRQLIKRRGVALNPLLGRTSLNLLIYTVLLVVTMVIGKCL